MLKVLTVAANQHLVNKWSFAKSMSQWEYFCAFKIHISSCAPSVDFEGF